MKRILFFVALVCLMASCGTSKEKKVSVRDVEVDGWLKDYDVDENYEPNEHFAVNDGNYKFSLKDGKLIAEIPIKTIKTLPNLTVDEINDFNLWALDSNNEFLENSKNEEINMKLDNTEVIEKLLSSKAGDKNMLKFYYVLLDDVNILERIENFEIWIDVDVKNSSTSSSKSLSSGSSDWNKVLDEYEKYINQYIAYFKKAMEGDTSALSEYAGILEKAESFAEKLNEAKGNLSTSQMNRYLKLTEKLYSVFGED